VPNQSIDEIGALLRQADKSGTGAQMRKLLDQTQALSKAVCREQGSNAQGVDAPPAEELNAIAAKLRAEDPTLSKTAAKERAAKMRPDLYKEMRT
jgi:hypothetical protein